MLDLPPKSEPPFKIVNSSFRHSMVTESIRNTRRGELRAPCYYFEADKVGALTCTNTKKQILKQKKKKSEPNKFHPEFLMLTLTVSNLERLLPHKALGEPIAAMCGGSLWELQN